MRFRVYHARLPSSDLGEARVVYASDEDAVGRVEENRETGVVLRVPEALLQGELVDEERVIEELKRGDVLVLYGRRIIELAVELGYVAEDSVLDVNGLRHVQVFKFSY